MIPLQLFNSLDSTSDEARRQLEAGASPPFAIRAREQTQGRGTQGRPWLSGEGSLALTLVCSYSSQWAPSLQAGVIVAEWLEHCGHLQIGLKWPNDLMVRGEKIGGILCETHQMSIGSALMIGVGLNLKEVARNHTDFSYQVSSLEEQGLQGFDLDQNIQILLNFWERRWGYVALSDYLKRSVSIAQPYDVDGELDVSTGLGDDGSLLGKKKTYYSSQGLRWMYQKPSLGGLWMMQKNRKEWVCYYFCDPWGQDFEQISVNTISPPCLGWPLYVADKDGIEPFDGWEVVHLPQLGTKKVYEIRDAILR